MLRLDDEPAQTRSRRDVDFQFGAPLFPFLAEKVFIGRNAGLRFGVAAPGAHPDPLQLPLQGLLPLRLLLLFVAQPRLLLLQPRGIVALPGNSLPAVKFENPLGHIVQEVPVVGDGDDRSLVRLQVMLQPGHRFCVQVVGGFVEEQDVGPLQEEAAEGHPPPLAAGENLHGGVSRRAAQGVHGHFQAGVEVPGVHGVQLVLDLRLPVAQAGHLFIGHGVGELLADPVVFRQEFHRSGSALLHDVPDGQGLIQLRLLLQKPDGISRRGDRLAVELRIDPGQDPQQGTLARPVQSEDADLGSVKIGQGNVLENRFLVVNLGHSDHGVDDFAGIPGHAEILPP
ncbi:MAG: hypothetical protein A4E69_00063 [Syntrophus sp. PtaB.Bin138]|nr:MAG: hypothetical protein A4E69_00063 [Syntrophus sp. PtaB.Bin138]